MITYLIKNYETGARRLLLKHHFNMGHTWHSPEDKKEIKKMLEDFKKGTQKVVKVYFD